MFQPKYEELVTQVTTPAYVFDIDVLCNRIQFIKNKLGNKVQLCYAMKANPFVVKAIENQIDYYEVCSHGEFDICERAGINMNKIVLSGVYKAKHDLEYVIAKYQDTLIYTCESPNQFHMIHEIAKQMNIKVNALLRITTHNQFGMSEDQLCSLIEKRKEFPYINIIGIHHFSGTQRKKINMYKEELEYVDSLILKLENEYGYVPDKLEFGPGFYVEYFQHSKQPYDEEELLDGFVDLLDNLHFQGQITIELGRFIAATCGNYYTDIVDYKVNDVPYCIVNGGMHQTTYYGQMMAMKIPYYRQLKKKEVQGDYINCNISGSLCTINDNLVKGLTLQNPEVGDIIEFQRVGAYAMCEGISLFLSRDLPSVYLYSNKEGLQLQRARFETNILNFKQ
ncbi:alanine racemase [Candidatus Stoquefichus massiliensis]|uniref:alanine racemase n=1 Tax=Candidatus Stoquefichus massiliensis TaxID=1470350 RepID=UPI00048892AB|nr:alanine racemase [Candidatus Stoquefichus massiliensis]